MKQEDILFSRFYNKYRGLLISLANKLKTNPLDFHYLISDGHNALKRAYNNFDASLNVPEGAYVATQIRLAMTSYNNRQRKRTSAGKVHVPFDKIDNEPLAQVYISKPFDNPVDYVIFKEKIKFLDYCLDLLKKEYPRLAKVFEMRHMFGMRISCIADNFGVSIGRISQLLAKSYLELNRCVNKQYSK